MGTPIVTVGGKVVYPAPSASRNGADAAVATTMSWADDRDFWEPQRVAIFLGVAAIVGVLILLLAWIARRDRAGE